MHIFSSTFWIRSDSLYSHGLSVHYVSSAVVILYYRQNQLLKRIIWFNACWMPLIALNDVVFFSSCCDYHFYRHTAQTVFWNVSLIERKIAILHLLKKKNKGNSFINWKCRNNWAKSFESYNRFFQRHSKVDESQHVIKNAWHSVFFILSSIPLVYIRCYPSFF